MELNFTEKQLQQIKQHGLTVSQIEQQLIQFKEGIPFARVLAAATLNNGIDEIDKAKRQQLVERYENALPKLKVVKFVPASGAATRMFQSLFEFLNNPEQPPKELVKFMEKFDKFPFAKALIAETKKRKPHLDSLSKKERAVALADTMLTADGFAFGDLPKGLIPFHRYENHIATAFEEQLLEAAYYISSEARCCLHFTVSENHLKGFQEMFLNIQQRLEEKTNCTFEVSYSFQKPETDTVAVNLDNTPFVDEAGLLAFRPSGHGALIENLNDIEADMIFIKNIDNVVLESQLEKLAAHKKMLAGRLLEIQEKVFSFLHLLESKTPSEQLLDTIREFLISELKLQALPETPASMVTFLNRPIRVCGMVKNTGAPGGGPFWVLRKSGAVSKQIVELSQIDMADGGQQKIVNNASHFNPVDLVCGLKNYKGEKFDLTQYVNPKAAFISEKSVNGTPVKALELPGLWNGAMDNWITVFVEVPLYTFNPVKTVFDLLKESHQNPM
jgi:hypothetical protein